MPSRHASETPNSGDGSTRERDGSLHRSLVVSVLLAAVGIVVGFGLVLVAGLVLRVAGIEITPVLSIVLSLVLATGIGFGGVALLYIRYREYDFSYVGFRVPTLRELAYTAVGYVAALSLGLSATAAISLTGVEAGTNNAAQLGMENPEVLLLLIPASFLLIGPGEELLYRGVVQNRLRERLPAVAAIPLASLIFASIHYFSLSGSPSARLVSISLLVLPTLVFGAVYELSDNIVVPALTHGAYNATLFSLLYIALQFSQMA